MSSTAETTDLEFIGLTIREPEMVDRIRDVLSRITDWKYELQTEHADDGTLVGAGMIVKCAEADALRSTFPTLLGGLYIQGEVTEASQRIVADMTSTKPIFDVPQIKDSTPQPASEPRPETSAPDETKPAGPQIDYLRALGGLMKLAKLSESDLLGFRRTTGKIDESLSSLGEIAMVAPNVLEQVYNDWSNISSEMKRKGGVK